MNSEYQTPNSEHRTPNTEQKWERFERKFFVSPEKVTFARSLLSQICRRDSLYPRGRINSLYFDTPDLDHFQKSDDGSYEREKIRIRWYDNPCNQQDIVSVYLELKSKRGFASRKQRRKILVSAERLNMVRGSGFGDQRSGNLILIPDPRNLIPVHVILQTLSEFGYFSQEPLLPVILIAYERFRFTEILTGTRLSFDQRICSTLVAPGLWYSESSLMLEGGVIEIKGPSMEIPISLRSLSGIGIDWTRFSKYASCLESQMEKPGSVGRIRPSGRIELLEK